MKLLLVALSFFSLSMSQPQHGWESSAELELICVDVVICLQSGECFILEVCAEAEDLEDYPMEIKGTFGRGQSSLKMSGLTSFSKGSHLVIKPNTTLRLSDKGKKTEIFPSRSVIAGKYKVVNGTATLRLGNKVRK